MDRKNLVETADREYLADIGEEPEQHHLALGLLHFFCDHQQNPQPGAADVLQARQVDGEVPRTAGQYPRETLLGGLRGAAVEAAFAVGTPSHIQISTLRGGAASGRWTRRRAVLAVVDGDGAEQLFAGEGAKVLRCSAERPDSAGSISAKDLLRAVVDTGAGQIMVLPNGYVAAEELVAGCTAAGGWGLDVVPVPSGSMVQGLAALAVHEPGRAVVDDGYSMARAAGGTRHASVRVATDQALTWAGPCDPGDGLGIAGDEVLVVHPEVATAACGLIDLLLAAGGELVTVLTGIGVDDSMPAELAAHVHRYHRGTELVTYQTGHRGDALLIGVE